MSLPVSYYRAHPDEIPARISVLRDKAERIVAYNRTLNPDLLDEKQQQIMEQYGGEPGADVFPPWVFHTLKRTLDRLNTIYRYSRRAA